MPSLLEILNDPNYIDANEPTKQAIFDKYSALDKNYTGANAETQSAIRQRFGLGEVSLAAPPASNAPTGLSAELAPEQFKSGVTGMQQGFYANAAKNNAALLNVMDQIDAGKKITPIDDVLGYQDMTPEQRKQTRDSIQSTLTGTVAKTIKYGEEQKGYKRNPYADQVISLANESNYKGAWDTFKKDPTGVIQQLAVESSPNALPSLVGGAAGVVLRGGLPGLMTGLATGSFPVEFMSSITDSLRDSGVDLKDEKAVEAKLRDPKFIEEAGKRAMTRGTVIAAADAASGKLLMPFKAGQLGKNVARGAANVGIETGTEMGGEAAAQIATGEELKPGDILAEGLGAGPQAAGTTALKTITESRKAPEATPVTPVTPEAAVAPQAASEAIVPQAAEMPPMVAPQAPSSQDQAAMLAEIEGRPIPPEAPAAQPTVAPVAQPAPTAELESATTVPVPEFNQKALGENNYVFLDKGKVKSGYGNIVEKNGKKYISYLTPEGKTGERLLTPNILVNPNPDQIDLLSLYRERDKLANQKDELFAFLKKYKINPAEKADLGIDPADRRLPVGIFNKEKGLLLDDLARIAVEDGLLSERDLQEGVGGVESLRTLINDTLQGEMADTPQNLERRAQIDTLQNQIDQIEAAQAEPEDVTQVQALEKEAEKQPVPEAAAMEEIPPATTAGPVMSNEEADNLAVAYSKATVEEKKAAQDVANHYKGDVVWQEGPIALVRDFGLQDKANGGPLYRFVKNRSSYNYRIEDLTPAQLGVTQEQKDKLISIKNQLEDEAKAVHEKAPFLAIKQGVTGSPDLNKNILPIAKNWAKILGIKANVYITTDEDARANQANYTGPHRIIGYMGKREVPGVMTKIDDNSYAIVLRKTTSPSKMLETLAHEMGHIHEKDVFDKASPETRKAIETEFRKWYDSLTKNTPAKEMIETNLPKTMAQTTQMSEGIKISQIADIAYWTKFGEWYANQVSRWSVSSEKPLSVVDKFFAKLASTMRRFYQTVKGQKYLPSETMKQFLDNIAKEATFVEYAESKAPKGQMALFAKDLVESKKTTDTPAFKKWFGDSKVVNEDGSPKVVYHGTNADIQKFGDAYSYNLAKNLKLKNDGVFFFTDSPSVAGTYAEDEGANIIPAYLSIKNPVIVDAKGKRYNAGSEFGLGKSFGITQDAISQALDAGNDGVIIKNVQDEVGGAGEISTVYVTFNRPQIKSATGNKGTFSSDSGDISEAKGKVEAAPTKRKNYLGEQAPLAQWDMPDNTKMESFIYKIQDKYIDTKRAIQAIKAQVGEIADQWDAYLKEELYHGRTAKKVKDFLNDELLPIVQSMQKNGITLNEFDDYLHNRHAEERNIQIAKINPELPDAGSGIATQDAKDYMAKLPPAKAKALEAMANQIDKMIQKTQKILVNAGLESQDTIDIWNKTYKHYVPLMREDLDFSQKFGGTGAGFSTKGGSTKRAVGSLKEVADIFANIAAQRERAIVRSEKARVGTALYGLAIKNPNPEFWLPVNPDAIKDQDALIKELKAMGIDAEDAKSIIQEPKTPYIDEKTGLVAYRVNPLLRNSDNVFPVRIDGKDRFIFFNPNDERAMRMVSAIKNLDAEGLGLILGTTAKFTRWIASVNTQYNPVFGAYNFLRDVGGAQFNLTTTPIAGKQAAVTKNVFSALGGIYKDLRSERAGEGPAQGYWSQLWEEFQREGGSTGYRDQFSKSKEELNIIEKNIRELEKGNIKKGVQAVFNWLSDYNDALENAVRLSAYKVALDQGLSKERAASIAKNLTVNFNRKGAWGQQAGALYAFFNASVQGSTRLMETLKGPQGRKIIAGGLLLGSVQALALAMAGFGDDEPPEFVKERNLVIPFPGGSYFAIPMPLGLHVIPNAGRIATEMVLNGGKGSAKKIGNLFGVMLDSFNPVGNAGFSMQTIAPTLLDPIAAIMENRDSFGRPIAKEDRATNPSPGYTRSRDTASAISKGLSEFLNYASGGTKYQKGLVSPTADQLDYLIGQATGGVGREVMKTEQAITSLVTGEELPSYKVPLVGKFYGDIGSQAAQSNKFYDNITNMANHEAEIKGRKKNGEDVSGYLEDHPEARLWQQANTLENQISKLNREKKDLISRNAPKERIQRIEEKKTQIMTRFNERVRNLEEQ